MTTYKVTGPGYRGHKHGEVFDADLTDEQERRAKDRGAIRVVKRDSDDKPKAKKEEGDG